MIIKDKKKFNILVSDFIRSKREAACLSLSDLSKAAGLSKTSLIELEQSKFKAITFVNLFNIFCILKISQSEWDDLLEGTLE